MNKTLIYIIYTIVSLGLPYVVLMQFIKADDVVQFLMCLTVVFINSLFYPALRIWRLFQDNNEHINHFFKKQFNLSNIIRYFGSYFGLVLIAGLIMAYGYAHKFNWIIFGVGALIFWHSSNVFDKCFESFGKVLLNDLKEQYKKTK